jgi:hypothetical protein
MGASFFSHHSRESIVIGAKFFRDDLPYFVEALAEVAGETKYLGTFLSTLNIRRIYTLTSGKRLRIQGASRWPYSRLTEESSWFHERACTRVRTWYRFPPWSRRARPTYFFHTFRQVP